MSSLAPSIYDAATEDVSLKVAEIIDHMDISETTRAQYQREIVYFVSWLNARVFHPNILIDFKKHLRARSDIGAGTKAKYLSVARSLCRELYRLQLIPLDVTAGLKGFRVARQHKRSPISDEDIQRVFQYLATDEADIRARVIIALMLFQGLRRVEVSRLRAEDFNRDAKRLAVLGKGKDDYETVDLHPRTVEILTDYLARNNLKSGPLFPSRKSGDALTSNAIWRIAMKVHRQLGLGDRNLHGWRKAFTTRLIRSGMNLLEVQGYTRHASLGMLQVYYNRMKKEDTLPTYYAAFQH